MMPERKWPACRRGICGNSDAASVLIAVERIMESTAPRRPRYRDYPELFWDAEPDAVIDVSSDVTLARLLTRAHAATVARLVSPTLLRERLDALDIPSHTRIFWRLVLEGVPDGRDASSPERD